MAADPQHGLLLAAAEHVGGVAVVLAGIQTDVQLGDVQLGVVVSAADEEAPACVVDFLSGGRGDDDAEGLTTCWHGHASECQ